MKLYYSIRVIKAESHSQAIDKIEKQKFYEAHRLCDKVLTHNELKREFKAKNLK